MANGCLSHGGILVFHLFGELPDHLIKRVVDRFVYEPVAGIGIEIYLVPILLVEVKRRLNGRISLPQLDGPLRVTLHYHEVGVIKAQHGKHLSHDLEDKGFVVERKRLLASFLRKTVITDCFYIHVYITDKRRPYCIRRRNNGRTWRKRPLAPSDIRLRSCLKKVMRLTF